MNELLRVLKLMQYLVHLNQPTVHFHTVDKDDHI